MIQTIDAITINGSKQIWNGYIYNLQYQPSFGQTPSFCTLNLVSEDGTFSIQPSDLSTLATYTISVGSNLTLEMYPVYYERKEDESGKVLEIRFEDTSILLDKVNVVLNGRQGNDGTTYPINPYPSSTSGASGNNFNDPTITGNLNFYPNDKFAGSCYIPVGREILTVNETYNNVLQVVYNFAQLCDGIGINGIAISPDSFTLIQNSNQYYFASYIGTLRSVLTQWCTDLGYGFYWENNQIHFLDLTTNLVLNTTSLDNAQKDAYSESVSIEDTVGRVAVAFYGQDRQTLPENPQTATEISCKQIQLYNIGFTNDQIASIKAAYLGEQYFYAYHFYLNNAYGNEVLGLSSRTIADSSTQSQALDDSTAVFTQYYYSAMNTQTAQAYYTACSKLADELGCYFYKPMTRGSYHQLGGWDKGVTATWIKQDEQVGLTPIGFLASVPARNNESLNDFLLGVKYDPTSDPMAEQGGATGLTEAQLAVIGEDEDDDGVLLLHINKPNWKLVEVVGTNADPGVYEYVTPDSVGQYLQSNGVLKSLAIPFQTRANPLDILNSLSITGATQVAADVATGNYQLQLWGCASPPPPGSTLSLSPLQTPEDTLGPDQLFKCILSDNFSFTIPKVEEFFRSETDKTGNKVNCHSNVIKNELNFRNITNVDLTALGAPVYSRFGAITTVYGIQLVLPSVPNVANLEQAFKVFSQNLTYSKVDPTIVRTYSLPYIDLPDNYRVSIGNGLMNLEISIGNNGITSKYTMGTRFMQIPSLESIRSNLSFRNRTNESRFLPYGYVSYGL